MSLGDGQDLEILLYLDFVVAGGIRLSQTRLVLNNEDFPPCRCSNCSVYKGGHEPLAATCPLLPSPPAVCDSQEVHGWLRDAGPGPERSDSGAGRPETARST